MNKIEKLTEVALHIIAMEDDAHLSGHPEWYEIVKEAKEAIKDSPLETDIVDEDL